MDQIVEIVNEELSPDRRPLKTLTKASDINQRVATVLAEKLPIEELVDVIRSMIRATRPTKYGDVPDMRAQEAGVKLAMSYLVGLPTQRIETKAEQVASNDGDIFMRVLSSPALLASMETLFDQVRAAKVAAGVESGKP